MSIILVADFLIAIETQIFLVEEVNNIIYMYYIKSLKC